MVEEESVGAVTAQAGICGVSGGDSVASALRGIRANGASLSELLVLVIRNAAIASSLSLVNGGRSTVAIFNSWSNRGESIVELLGVALTAKSS